MRICLVATFPPSARQLNEYAYHIARELNNHPDIDLIILADKLTRYDFATDQNGTPIEVNSKAELPGFNVIRCWEFGSLRTPLRLLNIIRKLNPDVVWFNVVFSTFATPDKPFAAFAGLTTPAIARAAGFYTHITLHHILEHVDLTDAGIQGEHLFHLGAVFATRALLRAHAVSVLLSGYRRTLMRKYSAQNVLLGTHGTFASSPTPPDFSKRNNPERRILAIGHWGTYKRLETLMAAFPLVLKEVPHAQLIIGGANHHTRPGYWESIRDAQSPELPIDFRGYIPEEAIPDLFQSTSVLVVPYDSATGSSGPAHQACQYGIPIVCADIPDFRGMVTDENMAVRFYQVGSPLALAEQLIAILRSPELERSMAEHNFAAGMGMTMRSVINNYLRWFRLSEAKRIISRDESSQSLPHGWRGLLRTFTRPAWLKASPNPPIHSGTLDVQKDPSIQLVRFGEAVQHSLAYESGQQSEEPFTKE